MYGFHNEVEKEKGSDTWMGGNHVWLWSSLAKNGEKT